MKEAEANNEFLSVFFLFYEESFQWESTEFALIFRHEKVKSVKIVDFLVVGGVLSDELGA